MPTKPKTAPPGADTGKPVWLTLTEDDHAALRAAAGLSGARSMADFARRATMKEARKVLRSKGL